MKTAYQSWVHGNSVLLERSAAPQATGKSGVLASFSGGHGDIVGTGDMGGMACLRMGAGARFVMYDQGPGNAPKSGFLWVHYAVPSPSIHGGAQSLARRVMVNYQSLHISQLSIARVHVWDGNRRIFAMEDPPRSADGFNGGLPAAVLHTATPDPARLLTGNIGDRPVWFGIGVSLLIQANTAVSVFLEIRSVGVEFVVEDRT